MEKLAYLLLGVIAVWHISLTSSTKRMIGGETQGDSARKALYAIAFGSTTGALISRRKKDD